MPAAAVLGGSAGVVVYNAWANSTTNVYASMLSNGVWGAQHELSNAVAPAQATEVDAAAGGGSAVAVWSQTDPSGSPYHVWGSRYSGGSWSAATQLDDSTSTCRQPCEPHVGLASDGSGVASWIDSAGAIRYRTLPSGWPSSPAWPVGTISDPATQGNSHDLGLAVSQPGNAVFVWDANATDEYARQLVNNDPSSTTATLSTGTGNVPRVAVDANGDGLIAFTSGGTLQAAQISLGGIGPAASTGLAIGSDAFGLAVAPDGTEAIGYVGSDANAHVATRSGATWSASAAVNTGAGTAGTTAPAIGLASATSGYLVFQQSPSGTSGTYVSELSGSTWGAPLLLRAEALSNPPSLSVLASGTAVAGFQTSNVYGAFVAGNVPPTPSFSYSPSNPQTGDTVTFSGSATDPDDAIASYTWNWGDGSPVETGQTRTHAYAQGGSHTVTMTATDSRGASASTSQTVTVTEPPPPPADQPPTASFSFKPTQPLVGDVVTFDGSGSTDPDNAIVGWSWDFGDGATDSGTSVQHAFATKGVYRVTLTVTDIDGATSTITHDVGVATPADVVPIAAFSSYRGAGRRMNLDGTPSTAPNGPIASYAWTLGDGSTASGPTLGHTYPRCDIYPVQLTVTGPTGFTGSTTGWVTIGTVPNVQLTAEGLIAAGRATVDSVVQSGRETAADLIRVGELTLREALGKHYLSIQDALDEGLASPLSLVHQGLASVRDVRQAVTAGRLGAFKARAFLLDLVGAGFLSPAAALQNGLTLKQLLDHGLVTIAQAVQTGLTTAKAAILDGSLPPADALESGAISPNALISLAQAQPSDTTLQTAVPEAQRAQNALTGVAKGAATLADELASHALTAEEAVAAGLEDAVAAVKAGLLDPYAAVREGVLTLEQAVHAGLLTAEDAVLHGLVDAVKAVSSGLLAVTQAIHQGLLSVVKAVHAGLITIVDAVKAGAIDVLDAVHQGLLNARAAVRAGLLTPADAIAAGVVSAGSAVVNGLVSAAKALASGLFTFAQALKAGILDVVTAVKSGCMSPLQAIAQGFIGAVDAVKALLIDAWDAVKAGVLDAVVAVRQLGAKFGATVDAFVKRGVAVEKFIRARVIAVADAVRQGLITAAQAVGEGLASIESLVHEGVLSARQAVQQGLMTVRRAVEASFMTIRQAIDWLLISCQQAKAESLLPSWFPC